MDTLDTPAKQTRYWLDNSVLHNNGKIYVTFEHHMTICRALAVLDALNRYAIPRPSKPVCLHDGCEDYNEMRYDTGWNDCLQRLREIAE